MVCPKCGKRNMDGVMFCPYCGTPLHESMNEPVQYPVGDPQNNKSGNRKYLYAVAGTVILMIIVLGAAFYKFAGSVKPVSVAEHETASARIDGIESEHEDTSEKTSLENNKEESSYVETETQFEQNLQEQNHLMQNQQMMDGKEVIEIYAGVKAPAEDFVFPYSSLKILTDEELLTLESDDVQIMHDKSQQAINEIIAR